MTGDRRQGTGSVVQMLAFSIFLSASYLLFPAPCQAQVYGDLSYESIVKTILRFGAAPLTQDTVIDDYAKVAACDDFKKNFRDDFGLQDLRTRLRQKLPQQTAGFPDAYYFQSKMRLDRYDFTAKIFKLADKSQLHNINSFSLARLQQLDVCVKGEKLATMPADVGAVLDQPVTLEGLPISEDRARALVNSMNAANNTDRVIYARFSLLITFAPPVDSIQVGARYNMDAQLLNIEFFEDPQFQKPIWIYTRG